MDSRQKLVAQFCKLPGIGAKTAQRLVYHILKMPEAEVKQFALELYDARRSVRFCRTCGNLCEGELCEICANLKRDHATICVVRDSRDVAAIEKAQEYSGVYHVLGGTISPLEGIGPDDIAIAPLLARLQDGAIQEVILATNPDVQGEATASYLARLLSPFSLKVTRIAHGIPVGADLEYADEITIAKALEGRREI